MTEASTRPSPPPRQRPLAVACLVLALPVLGQGATPPDSTAPVADTAPGDSAATAAVAGAEAVDSTAAATPAAAVDPVLAWTHWPAIEPAIAPDRLDGPEDLLEKEEIIADRIDDLSAEDARLDTLSRSWRARHLGMSAQLEVLDDLAEVQLGGDLELQQRLDSARQDAEQAARRLALVDSSRGLLALRLEGLRRLARDYHRRAERLRAQEQGARP